MIAILHITRDNNNYEGTAYYLMFLKVFHVYYNCDNFYGFKKNG